MARGITKVVACRMETELADELEQAAKDAGKSVNQFLRDLVAANVHGEGGGLGGYDSEEDSARAAGLRKAYHEARVAIRQALEDKWPRRRRE